MVATIVETRSIIIDQCLHCGVLEAHYTMDALTGMILLDE